MGLGSSGGGLRRPCPLLGTPVFHPPPTQTCPSPPPAHCPPPSPGACCCLGCCRPCRSSHGPGWTLNGPCGALWPIGSTLSWGGGGWTGSSPTQDCAVGCSPMGAIGSCCPTEAESLRWSTEQGALQTGLALRAASQPRTGDGGIRGAPPPVLRAAWCPDVGLEPEEGATWAPGSRQRPASEDRRPPEWHAWPEGEAVPAAVAAESDPCKSHSCTDRGGLWRRQGRVRPAQPASASIGMMDVPPPLGVLEQP